MSETDSVLPPSELTSEARQKRKEVAAALNRCRHGTNVVMRKCKLCESEGVSDQPEGPNRS